MLCTTHSVPRLGLTPFLEWIPYVRRQLLQQGLWDVVVEGTEHERTKDTAALGFLQACVADHYKATIAKASSARDAWDIITSTFGRSAIARQVALHRERINMVEPDTEMISTNASIVVQRDNNNCVVTRSLWSAMQHPSNTELSAALETPAVFESESSAFEDAQHLNDIQQSKLMPAAVGSVTASSEVVAQMPRAVPYSTSLMLPIHRVSSCLITCTEAPG